MQLEYKNYSEDVLEEQHKLVTKVSKNWKGFGYPSLDQLKETYKNNENFTPETRHYAFKDGKMIGFISSAVENEQDGVQYGSIQMPFIENNDLEVEEFLMEKALKTLFEKNVKVIRTTLRKTWGDGKNFLNRNEYENGVTIAKTAQIDYKKYKLENYVKPDYVMDIDVDRDKAGLVKVFASEMTQTPEQIGEIIEGWREATRIVANVIVKDGEEVVAHVMIVSNPEGTNAFMPHISIYKKGEEKYRAEIFKYMMYKMQQTDIPDLNFNIGEQFFENEAEYRELGLDFDDVKMYEIKVDL